MAHIVLAADSDPERDTGDQAFANVTNRTVKATLKTVRKTARAPAPGGR